MGLSPLIDKGSVAAGSPSSPDSSKKPKKAFSRDAFFYAGSLDFDPLLDLLLVPLYGISLWFMWASTQRMQ